MKPFSILTFSTLGIVLCLLFSTGCTKPQKAEEAHSHIVSHQDTLKVDSYPIMKSEAEWKQILTSSQYRVLRKGGTELPFINEYNKNKEQGVYVCGACGQPLYSSETKYESGSGWPSFWKPIDLDNVQEKEDNSLFMKRTEIVCSNCGSHIGHVFDDGPQPTGLRYCMNSAALKFIPK